MSERAIEAAAKAIDAAWSAGDGRTYPFEDTEPEYQKHCRDTARAALAAAQRVAAPEAEADKWFNKACEEQALRMTAEAAEAALRCNCGAANGGKWAGIHEAGCVAAQRVAGEGVEAAAEAMWETTAHNPKFKWGELERHQQEIWLRYARVAALALSRQGGAATIQRRRAIQQGL